MNQFDVRMRGYDTEQVDQAITSLQQQLADLQRQHGEDQKTIATTQQRAENLQARLSEVTKQLETAHGDLQKLNSAYQDAVAKANKPINYKTLGESAQAFVEEAQNNAKTIVDTARQHADELRKSSEEAAASTVSTAKTQATQALEEARKRSAQLTDNAKQEANRILDTARKQSESMVEVATMKADEEQKRTEHYLSLVNDIRSRVANVAQLIDMQSPNAETPARHRQQVRGFDFKTDGKEKAAASPDGVGEKTVMMPPVKAVQAEPEPDAAQQA